MVKRKPSSIKCSTPKQQRIESIQQTTTQPKKPTSIQHLPYELRTQIWKNTIESQDVIVLQRRYPQAQRHSEEVPIRYFFKSSNIPVGLHVCYEFRQELLRHYTLVDLREPDIGIKSRHSKNCYVDFNIDTWFFKMSDYHMDQLFNNLGENVHRIRSLVFYPYIVDQTYRHWVCNETTLFRDLRYIYFTVRSEVHEYKVMIDDDREIESRWNV
jgi:hypothetical protein